jgi:hypothetical protein
MTARHGAGRQGREGNDMLQAYSKKTGEPVNVGDTVTDFRGDSVTLISVDRANGGGRDGKVTVEGSPVSYYASVFGLRVVGECQGHAEGPVMGETFYCDGTCISH